MLEKMMAKSDINNISKISEIESNASIQFLDQIGDEKVPSKPNFETESKQPSENAEKVIDISEIEILDFSYVDPQPVVQQKNLQPLPIKSSVLSAVSQVQNYKTQKQSLIVDLEEVNDVEINQLTELINSQQGGNQI